MKFFLSKLGSSARHESSCGLEALPNLSPAPMLSSLIYFIAKVSLLELYPAYSCYKTLKYGKTEQLAPSLVYWITATVFIVVEYFADLLLFW